MLFTIVPGGDEESNIMILCFHSEQRVRLYVGGVRCIVQFAVQRYIGQTSVPRKMMFYKTLEKNQIQMTQHVGLLKPWEFARNAGPRWNLTTFIDTDDQEPQRYQRLTLGFPSGYVVCLYANIYYFPYSSPHNHHKAPFFM
jgi:hypothetical protein